ncbi:MAG: histidine phosphatase family protein [Eubacteriaceae bacterium]|jgi:alpha-ribazole phosphatase|nr:histidine phosphatase family protein [Eubacteriaceae bacterium]
MTLTIQAVRHGRTEANEKKLFSGTNDGSVTEGGMRLLIEKKAAGIYMDTEWHYTSGMKRTLQTLQILFGDVASTPVPLLSEYNFGDFEMKSNSELMASGEFMNWRADQTGDYACPNGESNNQFLSRVIRGFEWTADDASKRQFQSITLISHGGTISFLYRYLTGDWKSHIYEVMPKHGEGYVFDVSTSKGASKALKVRRVCLDSM